MSYDQNPARVSIKKMNAGHVTQLVLARKPDPRRIEPFRDKERLFGQPCKMGRHANFFVGSSYLRGEISAVKRKMRNARRMGVNFR